MMNPKIKALWVAALRSGDYKQATQELRRGNAFCCLGVLCNLHAIAHPKIAILETSRAQYLGNNSILHDSVMAWAGLTWDIGDEVIIDGSSRALAGHNDIGKTFKQIAAAIEEQL